MLKNAQEFALGLSRETRSVNSDGQGMSEGSNTIMWTQSACFRSRNVC